MSYKLGIDIGSTTLKTVVLDENDQVLETSYERHMSQVKELTLQKVRSLESILKGKTIKVAITGSAGLGVADASGIDFVQEVFATAGGVKRLYPATDVVIELGGEDAKILFLKGALEERMNSTCAGGTGAFIDQMASLLDVSLEELDALGAKHKNIYPIASRCGVFAKTDIQALVNQGASKEDIAASIFQAVVNQTISGLAQGRPIKGHVLFLGGPLAFLGVLRERFVKTLGLDEETAIFPELAQYFVALSSAYYAGGLTREYSYEELIHILENLSYQRTDYHGLEPLFHDQQEYEEFCLRHSAADAPKADISTYSGKAYLGVDAGSTTTKVVLIDQQCRLLYTHYCSNLGSPLPIVKTVLEDIYEQCGQRIQIVQSAVTGYGEELIKNAFGIDYGLVETVAHYTAAAHFNPNVDFILDIGGQDIKCFEIRDKAISSVMLNEACSSGCGSFLETFAKSLDCPMPEFVSQALYAKNPVDLGTRCTVFMNSSVKQAQKNGATIADISAGLAISVVKNAIYKVIRASSAEDLGQNIVVQGGTFLNDAVLRSFERLIGKQVIRPQIAGLMGAFGAALYAMEKQKETTSLLTPQELAAFTHTSKVTHCGLCTNRCNLTVNTFANGNRYISGNRCERPIRGSGVKNLPNLYEFKLEKLKALKGKEGKRGKIGIPFVLNLYDLLPFWMEFFTSLSFQVVLSDISSRETYMKGQHTIPSDTVCYPAKLVHGHVCDLIEKGVYDIFYPCLTYNLDEGTADNHFNCPVVAYYPEVIEANVPFEPGVRFLYPYLDLNNRKLFPKRMKECLKKLELDIPLQEIQSAMERAFAAYEEHRKQVQKKGEEAIAYAKEHGLKTLVICGRPYHADPEINHGLDKLVSSLGFVIVSEDAIAPLEGDFNVNVLNQWTYHSRMYNAAYRVTRLPDTQLVQLVSFGCGVDAITTDEIKDILRSKGKLYTQIKIDEINNLGAVKIRLRSLLAAMEKGE